MLQEASGAKIIIRGRGATKDGVPATGHPDDEDELHVSIEGTDEAIDKALKEIEPLLFNPENALKLKTEQLQKLAVMNGVQSSSGFGAGALDMYGAASKFLNSLPQGGGDEECQLELKVANPLVGLVIGKGGEQIQKMQAQSGAKVTIARESEMLPGETMRSIILKGRPASVNECKRIIDEILNRGQQNSSSGLGQPKAQKEMDHAFIVKVKVPNNKVGIIIGKGGLNVKMIQERSRAQVQIPSNPDEDNPNVRTLSIGGDSLESVEAAQAEITLALQQAAANTLALGGPGSVAGASSMYPPQLSVPSGTSFVLVPDDKVGVIIGKGGVTIKELQMRLRVKISIPQTADVGSSPAVRTCRLASSVTNRLFLHFSLLCIELLSLSVHPFLTLLTRSIIVSYTFRKNDCAAS